MTKTEVYDAICEAFNNLYNWNDNCFDYWISELYDENENEIWSKWNEETLAQMEKDVMYAFGDLIDEGHAELIGK